MTNLLITTNSNTNISMTNASDGFSLESIFFYSNYDSNSNGICTTVDSTSALGNGVSLMTLGDQIRVNTNGGVGYNYVTNVANLITVGNWYHVACFIQQSSGKLIVFVNGVQILSVTGDTNIGASTFANTRFGIGSQRTNISSNISNQTITQVRLTKGGRYNVTSFTPPTVLYSESDTVALLQANNDGTNIIDSGQYNLTVTAENNTLPVFVSQPLSGIVY